MADLKSGVGGLSNQADPPKITHSTMASKMRTGTLCLAALLALTACLGVLRPHANPLTMPMPREQRPIRLGIIVSYETAMNSHCDGHLCGFEHAMIAKSFNRDSHFELYAIIEPGTLEKPEIRAALEELKIGNVLNGFDAQALGGLDVILTAFAVSVRPEMVQSIGEAVRGGVSFLSMVAWGTHKPGLNDNLLELMGYSKGFYMFNPKKTELKVMHEHPLFPQFHKGDVIQIAGLNGVAGKTTGLSLLALAEDKQDYCGAAEAKKLGLAPEEISIMNVHQFGKGRVLNFIPWGGIFPAWDGDAFNRRMVEWLAARS
jgi:hypothetical protein